MQYTAYERSNSLDSSLTVCFAIAIHAHAGPVWWRMLTRLKTRLVPNLGKWRTAAAPPFLTQREVALVGQLFSDGLPSVKRPLQGPPLHDSSCDDRSVLILGGSPRRVASRIRPSWRCAWTTREVFGLSLGVALLFFLQELLTC